MEIRLGCGSRIRRRVWGAAFAATHGESPCRLIVDCRHTPDQNYHEWGSTTPKTLDGGDHPTHFSGFVGRPGDTSLCNSWIIKQESPGIIPNHGSGTKKSMMVTPTEKRVLKNRSCATCDYVVSVLCVHHIGFDLRNERLYQTFD